MKSEKTLRSSQRIGVKKNESTSRSYALRERKGKRKTGEGECKGKPTEIRERKNIPPLLYEPLCGYTFRQLPDTFNLMKVNDAFMTTHRRQPWLPIFQTH